MFDIFGERSLQDEIRHISPEEAVHIIEKDTNNDVIVLDVREPHEFNGNNGHIKDAQLVPLRFLPLKAKELEHHKDKKIIVVCCSGRRSYTASSILKRHGFKNIYNLKGGMILWKKLGLKSHSE